MIRIDRRTFIKSAGLPLVFPWTHSIEEAKSEKNEFQNQGPVIKSFSVFKGSGNFNRLIAMNAYDKAPKGINGTKSIVTILMTDGTVGIGPIGYRLADEPSLKKLKELIGKDPSGFYHWGTGKITGVKNEMKEYFFDARYAWFEGAVLDAIGKQKQLPVWKLFGEFIRNGIDPYDGTLYFEDIAHHHDVSILAESARQSKADGFRSIKMKLGRPAKWMPGEAGVQRDIDAFIAVREAVGSNFKLMADANNGYAQHFDWAVRLLKSCAPYDMFFMEEIFPDDTQQYKKLREALLQDNIYIPIADGESIVDLNQFDQYMIDGVYQYLQPDMHTCGFSNILALARKAQSYPHIKIIPHVWQSQLGLLMSLHISKIQKNINHVEDSRYTEHAISARGYSFMDGEWFIPDKPGWGVELSPGFEQFIVDKTIVVE